MPATEQTWRNQKTLHVVFAVTTLVMVVASVWMTAADHEREWKDWQLQDRGKEAWMISAQHASLAHQYEARKDLLEREKTEALTTPIDADLIDQFKSLVAVEDARLANGDSADPTAPAEGSDEGAAAESELPELDPLLERFNAAADAAAQAREEVESTEDGEQAEAVQDRAIAEEGAIKVRKRLLSRLQRHIRVAKQRQDKFEVRVKSLRGERTAAVSEKGLAIHEDATQDEIDAIQRSIDVLDDKIGETTFQLAAAVEYRRSLETIVDDINTDAEQPEKELAAIETDLNRLQDLVSKNTTNPLEWMTRLPVLDALYDGNVRIHQQWLPDLTINYNFADVARFDRCMSCHQSIMQAKAGTAAEPAYPTLPEAERHFTVELAVPEDASGESLEQVFGLSLAEHGVVDRDAVTVRFVVPESTAARSGLTTGDVLLSVRGVPVYEPETAGQLLLEAFAQGDAESISIEVERGLNHPFTTHPRLDLYLTDASPHPQNTFGCTICHDGQGSGTEFVWTSHTPNDHAQLQEWINEYGWFDNHHWIFPMKPARFAESNCIKCHHEKGGLAPSERYPEPPAPKLVEGWSIIEDYGCFGCHEIGGYAGPDTRIGPDVRLEPNYHEAAAQLLTNEGLHDKADLDENEQELFELASRVVDRPEDEQARDALWRLISNDAKLASSAATQDQAWLTPASHNLEAALKPSDAPGKYRKVGPSLRNLSSKVEFDWLYSWIRKPSGFRPNTKMPQFFLQYEHLQEEEDAAELAESEAFEPIEIYALSWFLLRNSADEFVYHDAPENVTEAPSSERGQWLFESRGCLACHSHADFPEIKADQGPDLSRLAAKLGNQQGRKWLYSWLKQPNEYHTRTVMPDVYLDPIEELDVTGNPTGQVTDPAADIVEYLLGVDTDWRPEHNRTGDLAELTADDQRALADLAVEWLASDSIPAPRAKRYLQEGIPEALAPRLKADELLLVGINDENRTERQLEFVARRTVGKYGCFGCHDIPGFETAKPIGAALAEWGRKQTSMLAFENIGVFLAKHGLAPENPLLDDGPWQHAQPDDENGHAGGHDEAHHAHLDPGESKYSTDESYFVQAITSHSRDGFLWQKLRYPRSYDYKTTENKGFNERLRMPRFPFTDEQREAVMTFVLGLVNEPPAEQYVYQPNRKQQAIVDGRQVLERYNCAGCHVLEMERWQLAYDEETFYPPEYDPDFPFLEPHFTKQEIAESLAKDDRGLMHVELYGMPAIDQESGQPYWVDEDQTPITREELIEFEEEEGEEIPIFYQFQLYRNALIAGEPALPLGQQLVPAKRDGYGPADGTAYPAWGGDLAHYLFPRVIEKAKEINPAVDGGPAWGWLPPFLMDEGEKVQTDWLHGFLMDPTALRPAAVMRMPNFHMSSEDAAKLVDYFAAKSDVEFPYEYNREQRETYLTSLGPHGEAPFDEAMNIVVSSLYCIKCHGVAGFEPKGDRTTFGPNLADVYRRLRPEYVRNWIANPPRILPYTGMPKNVPYTADAEHLGGVSQDLFAGTSIEQVEGLVSLLMNFDKYAKQQTNVTQLVDAAAVQAADAQASEESAAESTENGQASLPAAAPAATLP